MPATNSSSHCEGLVGRTIDNTLPGGPRSELEFIAVLGQGAYGVVYLARDFLAASLPACPSTAHPLNPLRQPLYAVKCLNKLGLTDRQRIFQSREIMLHAQASVHPNVVSMHNVIESASKIYVVMDFCPGGDLFGMIVDEQRFLGNDTLIKRVFLQIVDAVADSHSLGIYHRDLKPENILATDPSGRNVVLADFGLATSARESTDFGCGSSFYMSPECNGGLYGERLTSYASAPNDVWALGVILVNLVCGRNPWKQATPDDPTFLAFLKDPAFLTKMLPISKDVDAILRRVFALSPDKRMGLAELRDAVAQVERFTMTEDELTGATKATRQAAKAYAYTRSAQGGSVEVPKVEVVEAQPSSEWEFVDEDDEDAWQPASSPILPSAAFDRYPFATDATDGPAQPARISACPRARKSPPTPLADLNQRVRTSDEHVEQPDSASDASASQPATPTDAAHPTVNITPLEGSSVEAGSCAHAGVESRAKTRVASYLSDWPLFATWAEQHAC